MSIATNRHTTWEHHVDDEIYKVRMIWLGPSGVFTFPWDARYVTYGVFAVVFGLIMLIEYAAKLASGWPLTEVAVSVAVTFALMRTVTYERPLLAMLRIFAAIAQTSIRSRARGRLRPPVTSRTPTSFPRSGKSSYGI